VLHRAWRQCSNYALQCLLRIDIVEERFLRGPQERLIQNPAPRRNLESKIRARGFDYLKIEFHSQFTKTFSTVTANSRHGGNDVP
jgi:hypothetical protein